MREDEPLISVVIPCYNAERWIAATLRSVLNQDWHKLEVIVVDDGSSDGSASLVASYFPQVKLIRQANQGVAAARNLGIDNAQGEWVSFIDADDFWLPSKLRTQWQALRQHPQARVSYTAWQVWPSEAAEPTPSYLKQLAELADEERLWQGASGWIYPELLLDCVVWTSTVLMEKKLFDEVGKFDENLRVGEDYDLWLRLSQVTPILRVAKPCALYRLHPGSITRASMPENYQAKVVERAISRWGYAGPDGRSADKKAVERMLARTWRNHAAAQFGAGLFDDAYESVLRAMSKDKLDPANWKILFKISWRRLVESLTA